tara:strand:- start:18371 stop:18703 length:333 start_codon:yes stop_codon:yes gene_type:complete
MSDEIQKTELDVLKQVVGELRSLNERLAFVESENNDLRKAMEDPEAMMKKAGYLRYSTPHPAETFDPLNRGLGNDNEIVGPFAGTGETFQKSKSRYDELQEWIEAEEAMR